MFKIWQILIAKPNIPEYTYRKSVIMICKISEGEVIGIILNKPSMVEVKKVFANFNFNSTIFYGGPIRSNYISFIYSCKEIVGGAPINDEICWDGGALSFSKVCHNTLEANANIRFYAGFTGWEKGDLESELINNYWWQANISVHELFHLDATLLYEYLLKREQIRCELF